MTVSLAGVVSGLRQQRVDCIDRDREACLYRSPLLARQDPDDLAEVVQQGAAAEPG
ncbi:MAG: hypothetical protein ACRDTT_01585 [Pseudonocardiaceae bacterium]